MWLDPLTFLGILSIPFLVSNLATVAGFLLSAIFAWKYTVIFYEGRDKPMSWGMIIAGLSTFCLSELGQFLVPYRVYTTEFEFVAINTVQLAVLNFAMVLIAAVCYYPCKGVQAG